MSSLLRKIYNFFELGWVYVNFHILAKNQKQY